MTPTQKIAQLLHRQRTDTQFKCEELASRILDELNRMSDGLVTLALDGQLEDPVQD